MMDQMIITTLVLISTFSIVNGQLLHCFVCTNCPNLDLGDTVSQPCDFDSTPNTTPVPPPNTTFVSPPDTTFVSPPDTTFVSPPDTTFVSPPNTPPTPTLPTTTQFLESDALVYELFNKATNHDSPDILDENSDKPSPEQRSKQISPQPSYRNMDNQIGGIYNCFRIERIDGDAREVVRGCVVTANTKHQTCVEANSGNAPLSCRICNHNNCNTATRNATTKTSIIILFTSIVSMTLLR